MFVACGIGVSAPVESPPSTVTDVMLATGHSFRLKAQPREPTLAGPPENAPASQGERTCCIRIDRSLPSSVSVTVW
jgi:hypothetical protein